MPDRKVGDSAKRNGFGGKGTVIERESMHDFDGHFQGVLLPFLGHKASLQVFEDGMARYNLFWKGNSSANEEIESQIILEDWIGTRDNTESNLVELVPRRNDFYILNSFSGKKDVCSAKTHG